LDFFSWRQEFAPLEEASDARFAALAQYAELERRPACCAFGQFDVRFFGVVEDGG
jgi:hypothetical protein